jgi:class 3 adenylate cyclase
VCDYEHTRKFLSLVPTARLVELPGSDADIYLGDTSLLLTEVEAFVCEEGGHDETVRRAAARPLATVMFTDIVASTDHLTMVGDAAWRRQLDDHDETAGHLVAAHHGRVVKKLGDGILATFDFPAGAIRCATNIQSRMAERGIRVRTGLHTGEIELRNDGDVTGIAVHIASRIADLATADEILVSRTVVDLTAGSEITYDARGEHQLKGIPGTWPIFLAHAPSASTV